MTESTFCIWPYFITKLSKLVCKWFNRLFTGIYFKSGTFAAEKHEMIPLLNQINTLRNHPNNDKPAPLNKKNPSLTI